MNYAKSLQDLYEALEINPNASEEVMNAAAKALKVKYHPDNRKTGNERRFKEVCEVFDILSDPTTRVRYHDARKRLKDDAIGEYKILSEIAEGGFGTTYKAKHIIVKEFACIKKCSNIDPFDEEILIDEARAMWNLRHYSVPSVKGLVRFSDRKLGLVMSYIPGPTLTQILEKLVGMRKTLDPEHVAWVTERALNALRYIHYNGVVHGDLKPQNVIVEPDKHLASIVDFGLSKIKPKTGTGSKGYTELFSAPEIIGGGDATPQSDFYSLGMTMIFALSGDQEHLERKEIPKGTPEPIKRFIRKLIVRDPLSRPRWQRNINDPDLWDEFLKVREESFGRSRSQLKPIPGF